MLTKNQLKEIHDRLQYDHDYVEEQAGYDYESFFASRQWAKISNEIQKQIDAVEKEILRPPPKNKKTNRNR